MVRRKRLAAILAILSATAVVWLPGVVCAATGQIDKYQAYLAALDYLLRGLIEYFKAVIELFKTAVS